MGAWDAALSFKRVLFFFGILQLLHIVVVAPEWGDGTGPKVVSGHFDILRLEIIGRKPRAGGQDLENGKTLRVMKALVWARFTTLATNCVHPIVWIT